MAFRRMLSDHESAGDRTPAGDEGGSFVTPYFWIGIAVSLLVWALGMLLIHLLL